MKKTLLSILLLVTISSAGMAQSSSSAFNNGDNLLHVGVGLGSPFFGFGYSASLPFNPTITYERGITDVISVGGTLSFANSKFNGDGFSFKESATYIGVRGSYHVNQYLNLGDNVDLYGGASLGYVVVSVSDNQNNFGAAASAPGFGLFAGGKYYFQPNFGVYAEVGYESLSFLNIGVTFKF
jgi:hypothetical protein